MNKKILSILVLVIAVIILGVVFGLEKKEVKAPVMENQVKNGQQTATTTEEVSEIDTSNWILFDSQKDAGIKFKFIIRHPEEWVTQGSVDGGGISIIPFYKKEIYSEKCITKEGNVIICDKVGQIAQIQMTRILEDDSKKIDGELYSLDSHNGYINSGINKQGIMSSQYISDNKIWVIFPNIDGYKFEFIMAIENEESKNIFYEILKNSKFN
ncbi:MAG: hypothetical protein AAB614_01960 [Patescibacteria group bacterium]